MKKLIALVLTAIMVLSLAAVATVAEEEYTLVSQGKTYTITGAGEGYTNLTGQWPSQYDANLTDGVAYEELTFGQTNNWFGFYFSGTNEHNNCIDKVGAAVIDLGTTTSDIAKFRVHLGNHHGNGVPNPASIKVYVSGDGDSWNEAGEFTGIKDSTVAENAVIAYWLDLVLDKAVSGRYVKFEFTINGVFGFVNELEVYTANVDSSAPKTFFVSHFDANDAEGAGSVFTETDTMGGWAIHVAFAPVAGVKNVYEVTAITNGLSDGSGTTLTVPAGGFVWTGNYGNNWPALMEGKNGDGASGAWYDDAAHLAMPNYVNDNCNAAIAIAEGMKVGEKYIFTNLDIAGKKVATSTPDKQWYEADYVCTTTIAPYVPEAKEEPIVIDGSIDDKGWGSDWTTVNGETGVYQNEPAGTNSVSYKYQVRKDAEKLYIAIVYDGEGTTAAAGSNNANGTGLNFRVWFHNGDKDATVYTNFIDACICADGTTGYRGMLNTQKTSNKAGANADTTVVAAAKIADGKSYCEFSIDLDEIGGDAGQIFFAVSNMFADTENLCLFAPAIAIGAEVRLANFPYNAWYSEGALKVADVLKVGAKAPKYITKTVDLLEKLAAGTVEKVDCDTSTVTITTGENGEMIFTGAAQWPSVNIAFDAPITVDVANTTLKFKATITGDAGAGARGSIHLNGTESDKNSDDIFLHQFSGLTLDGSGDAGAGSVIELEVPLSELAFCNYDASEGYAGKIAIESDTVTFTGLTVYACDGGIITISEFELVTTTPATGDMGVTALIVLAVVAMIGTGIVIKARH